LILQILSSAYGAAASRRRRWYADDPARRRRLARPVVSVGNLRVGGTGKTPIAAHIARLLRDNGQRPAVLTRGYGRRAADDGVTVVSDGDVILADVSRAGDEPLMLARALPGVPVFVGANRYLSGLLAERRFGATVHVLDDGFQHVELARDVDLVLIDESDLADRPLPAGRLREPLANGSAADAALVDAGYTTAAERIGRALGVPTVFRVTRALSAPRVVSTGDSVVVPPDARVFAVAGIARPERFFSDLTAVGWQVVGTLTFPDHHQFRPRDVRRIAAAAKASSAAVVLTTDKDAVRLAACDLAALPIAAVPLSVGVEPHDAFSDWLMERVHTARATARISPVAPRSPHAAPRTLHDQPRTLHQE
jgi:tetraacyldisaccharide 4'-kinase